VLILGASGGVGVCCVQLAKLAGATVIAATGSQEQAARLRALGADHIINYAEQDFVQAVYALYGKPARRGAAATTASMWSSITLAATLGPGACGYCVSAAGC
jgi:NADPH:quinone reductase-like Zn-dependent oxidoreductase